MKLSVVLLSSLASLAVAKPHDHHQHKRDVKIVTEYQTQIVTAGAAAASSTAAGVNKNIVSDVSSFLGGDDSSSTDSTTTLASSSGYFSSSAAASASSDDSASSTGSSSTSSSTSTGDAGAASGAKGITYSPYTNSGSCKDADTIKSDIEKLSDFDIIRLYDVDCSGVENVLAAKTSSQKIFAGIYHVDAISSAVETLSSAVDGNWDDIYTVSIGNELVNAGTKSASQIEALVSEGRSALESAGYTGKVVSVDTLVAVQNNPELCDYSDYVAVNSHAFWDGNTLPDGAGSFLKTQIANIKKICGGTKDVLITETGWPTKGDTYEKAVPSTENQETALKSIIEECGDQVLVFTTYNDLWKDPGTYGVEQYWGVISE